MLSLAGWLCVLLLPASFICARGQDTFSFAVFNSSTCSGTELWGGTVFPICAADFNQNATGHYNSHFYSCNSSGVYLNAFPAPNCVGRAFVTLESFYTTTCTPWPLQSSLSKKVVCGPSFFDLDSGTYSVSAYERQALADGGGGSGACAKTPLRSISYYRAATCLSMGGPGMSLIYSYHNESHLLASGFSTGNCSGALSINFVQLGCRFWQRAVSAGFEGLAGAWIPPAIASTTILSSGNTSSSTALLSLFVLLVFPFAYSFYRCRKALVVKPAPATGLSTSADNIPQGGGSSRAQRDGEMNI
jgi:hypothetical protein